MKRFLVAAAILCAATAAEAQTAVVPAPVIIPTPVSAPLVTKSGILQYAYPYNGGSGFYAGVNTMVGAAQSSASASGIFATSLATGNLTAIGGAVGGTVGYTSGGTNLWWAVEGSGDWQNITGTTTGASMNTRWQSEQVFKLGGTLAFSWLSTISSIGVNFPTFTLPLTPSGISVAAAPHPYIMAGVKEEGISGTVGQAGGTTVLVAPMIGAGTISQVLNGSGQPTGVALDLFAEVVFANKGLGFNNVFGANGGPVAGNLNLGTQYFAGTKVLF